MQVSQLIRRVKEESAGNTESVTREQLRNKLATLSQSRLTRATDALTMIWNGVMGPLDQLAPEPKLASSAAPILLPNWHRVRLALLKSISTGTFIDIQFYAYTALRNNLPSDPRPLFTSSIAIEEWAPAITTRKWEGSLLIYPMLTYGQRNCGNWLPTRAPRAWTNRRLRMLARGASGGSSQRRGSPVRT